MFIYIDHSRYCNSGSNTNRIGRMAGPAYRRCIMHCGLFAYPLDSKEKRGVTSSITGLNKACDIFTLSIERREYMKEFCLVVILLHMFAVVTGAKLFLLQIVLDKEA